VLGIDREKLLNESNANSFHSPLKGDLNLGWDYGYYNPDNNPFSKNWLNLPVEKTSQLLVTEVNRATECVTCGRRIGEVSSTYYEIKKSIYCASCGQKLLALEEQKKIADQQGEPIAAT
jgi:DNA-directed RNA polymerase subunit RPC12/RpoP